MQVEGLACAVVGARQTYVTVIFTDEHSECKHGMPVALVRGCAVARNSGELERLLCPGSSAEGVRLYVEPGTNAGEVSNLWLAGFLVRIVRAEDAFSVPGGWHLAAHRHYSALAREMKRPTASPGKFGGVA